MRKYRTMVLAAGLLLTAATPVFAQAAIQEPGMFSFYHPNLDASYCAQRYRSYDPATGTFISNSGRRHPCE